MSENVADRIIFIGACFKAAKGLKAVTDPQVSQEKGDCYLTFDQIDLGDDPAAAEHIHPEIEKYLRGLPDAVERFLRMEAAEAGRSIDPSRVAPAKTAKDLTDEEPEPVIEGEPPPGPAKLKMAGSGRNRGASSGG